MKNWRTYIWSFFVAQRYLFSKKSHNTINIITLVSMLGVAIGTMALICVLSVLNGFEKMVDDSFTAFDPDLRITSVEGRTFSVTSDAMKNVRNLKQIAVFAELCASNALASYEGRQTPVQVCGVSDNYVNLNDIRSLVIDGDFSIENRAVAGVGVANTVNFGYDLPLTLYVPKRYAKVNLARPDNAFRRHEIYLSGIVATGQPELDDKCLFVPLSLAQNLFDYSSDEVSSVELKLQPNAAVADVQKTIQRILGPDFSVQNRHEQQADFYRILQIERWITFLILVFILFIAICNIIGSLSMLMINKKADTQLFYALGARKKAVQILFLCEGWMIAFYGALVGIVLGVAVCLLQQYVGFLKMGVGYVVENYPVALHWGDVVLVFFTVLVLGFALAAYPVSVIRKKRVETV